MPSERFTRHAAVVILSVGLFVPGYTVQLLLLLLLSEVPSISDSYGLSILSIGPALCLAPVVGWIVKKWYGTSTATAVTVGLMGIYALAFYTLETVLFTF